VILGVGDFTRDLAFTRFFGRLRVVGLSGGDGREQVLVLSWALVVFLSWRLALEA
jgi:hypothetical protein